MQTQICFDSDFIFRFLCAFELFTLTLYVFFRTRIETNGYMWGFTPTNVDHAINYMILEVGMNKVNGLHHSPHGWNVQTGS